MAANKRITGAAGHVVQVFTVWRGGNLPHQSTHWPPHLRFDILLRTPFCGVFCNHLEERLLDQALVRASYTPPPPFGVVRVAYPNIWFLTSNPL